MFFELLGFLLGTKVNRTHGIALAEQPFMAALNRFEIRQFFFKVVFGNGQQFFRRGFDALTDAFNYIINGEFGLFD